MLKNQKNALSVRPELVEGCGILYNSLLFWLLILCVNLAHCTQPEPRLAVKKDVSTVYSQPNSTMTSNKQLVFAPIVDDLANVKEQLEKDFARELPSPKEARARYKKCKKITESSLPRWGSFFSSKTISDMDYKDLLQRKNELLLTGDYQMASTYLEHMLKKAQIPEQIMYIMLEWGQVLMHIDQVAKAETVFRDFIKVYPGNQYAQMAREKAIECSFCQTQMCERDQTKTEETLKLIQEFYTHKDHYDPSSVQRVMDIELQCQQKLAQAKLNVIEQYIIRSRYAAAHTCIKAFRETDYATMPTIEPELLHMEILLARAQQDKTVETAKLQELSIKFPMHEVTVALNSPRKFWFARV